MLCRHIGSGRHKENFSVPIQLVEIQPPGRETSMFTTMEISYIDDAIAFEMDPHWEAYHNGDTFD